MDVEKFRRLYKFVIISYLVSKGLLVVFIITALVLRELLSVAQGEYLVKTFFVLAGIFEVISWVFAYYFVKCINMPEYREMNRIDRNKKRIMLTFIKKKPRK